MTNERVNWESLHKEIMAQSDDRHQMELRIVGVLSDGLNGIRKDMRTERDDCNKRFCAIEDNIVVLKVADRKWGGVVGLFAAGVAGLGAWLGQR